VGRRILFKIRCGLRAAEWFVADLTSNPADCTLAYGHHPRWSSGEHGSNRTMANF
jgi:alkaline phosphatase